MFVKVCGVFIVVCEHLPPQICSRIIAPLPPLIITTCLGYTGVSKRSHFELSICADKAMWGERFWATFAPLDLSNLAPSPTFNPESLEKQMHINISTISPWTLQRKPAHNRAVIKGKDIGLVAVLALLHSSSALLHWLCFAPILSHCCCWGCFHYTAMHTTAMSLFYIICFLEDLFFFLFLQIQEMFFLHIDGG